MLLLAACLFLLPADRSFCQSAATYHSRADAALQSFLLTFWNGNQQYFKHNFPDNGALTGYWTYANSWEAVLDGVERTGGQQYSGWIETLFQGQNRRGWLVDYYDDECWMAMALVRAYDLTGQSKYLNQAKLLYTDIQGGWDTTCCGSTKGGVWWNKAHTQKATASNAGAALAGAMLYRRTHEVAHLNFAIQAFDYWYANMVDPGTFQVADHFEPNGNKVWWKFTYNEGLLIGAAVELFEATGLSGYLTKAHNIAGFMRRNEVTSTSSGPVLFDGSNADLQGDAHQFKGPAFRQLQRLYLKDKTRTTYYSVLKGSADALWNLARNSTSMVFSINWAGPVQTTGDVSQVNAACTALSGFAQLSGAYPGSGLPARRYEAENATLSRLGLETNYGGFTGWAYVAGWNAEGQAVEFNVVLPSAGTRMVTLRYAAGAGNATRLIQINGTNAFAKVTFPGTGAWGNYSTVTLPWDFSAGTNNLSVILRAALGSGNYLNLDHITVDDLNIQITDAKKLADGRVSLSWNSVSNLTYRLQFKDSLSSAGWTTLGNPVTASGSVLSRTNPAPGNVTRYYRVVQP